MHEHQGESGFRLFSPIFVFSSQQNSENDLKLQFQGLSVEYVTKINICHTSCACIKVKAFVLNESIHLF